jgi:hypothetical protein
MLQIQPRREISRPYAAQCTAPSTANGQPLVTAAAGTVIDTEERLSGACPSSEEVRMVRAIALSAVSEALMRGESHVAFRGFQVDAARLPCGHKKRSVVRVELVVCLDGHIIDRETAEILPVHFD